MKAVFFATKDFSKEILNTLRSRRAGLKSYEKEMQAMHGCHRRNSRWLLQALLYVLVFGSWLTEAVAETLLLGVVPQHSAVELARHWGPLITLLEERTGLSLAFETAKDIPTFETRLDEGRYDVIY